MEIQLTLQPKQKEAFYKSFFIPVFFYGGGKGGGKSYLVRAREVYRRLAHAKTKGLIVRKTYPELLANHIRPLLAEYPFTRDWYNKAEKTIYWPNGSTTEFSYLRATDDVYTYQGREYDDIDVDEITQHEEEVFKVLRSSNRTTHICSDQCAEKIDYIPTMLLTGNPGGVGHQWVKRIFIDRVFQGREKASDFHFVPALVQDNKALLRADPEYVRRLEDLPEHLRRAYLYGDWNIHAGLAFTELAEHIHVIEPFEFVDPRVRWFGGFDWGYQHPFGFVLCAIDGSNNIFVTNYARAQFKRPDEIGKQIKSLIGDKRLTVYAGTDAWAERGSPSIVQQLRQAVPQISWLKAYTDRVQGVAQLRKLFAYQNTERLKPQLYFFKNTIEVFNQVAGMQYDEKKPEDVMKVDADDFGNGGDDLYDACFPAWTKVGLKHISSIMVGDEISTGVVKNSWCSGVEKLHILVTKNGRVLMATPNHPVAINNGYRRLDALRYGDIITVCKSQKQFYLRELFLDAIQSLKDIIFKITTIHQGTIRKGELNHYIGKSGNITTEQSLKDLTFTTKTETQATTTHRTLSFFQEAIILGFILEALKSCESILKQSGQKLLSGIRAKRVGDGILNTAKKPGRKEIQLIKFVNSVVKNTRQKNTTTPDSVPINVSLRIEEKLAWILQMSLVSTVGLFLRLINSNKHHSAQDGVLFTTATPFKTRVYNLEVSPTHNYFANDILVHNCRYAVTTWLRPKQIEDKKTQKEEILDWIESRELSRSYAEDL